MTYVRQRESEQVQGKVENFWQSQDLRGYMLFLHGRQEEKGEEEADVGERCIEVLENYGFIYFYFSFIGPGRWWASAVRIFPVDFGAPLHYWTQSVEHLYQTECRDMALNQQYYWHRFVSQLKKMVSIL